MPKYIFVTGGVVSSVGKGITTAALGRILKSRGVPVSIQKLDPYLNVDPGTMSPYQLGDHRPNLPGRDLARAAGRLPRRHDPGRATPHQRDQGAHPRRRPRN